MPAKETKKAAQPKVAKAAKPATAVQPKAAKPAKAAKAPKAAKAAQPKAVKPAKAAKAAQPKADKKAKAAKAAKAKAKALLKPKVNKKKKPTGVPRLKVQKVMKKKNLGKQPGCNKNNPNRVQKKINKELHYKNFRKHQKVKKFHRDPKVKVVAKPKPSKLQLLRKKRVHDQKKALNAKKHFTRGRGRKVQKIRTSVHFRRPRTFRLPKNPKYTRRAVPKRVRMDQFRIVKAPLTTESALKNIEETNVLVFIVDLMANKHQIKAAVQKLYDTKVARINTLVRPDGKKKAFVKLAKGIDALDVANKIGIL